MQVKIVNPLLDRSLIYTESNLLHSSIPNGAKTIYKNMTNVN